MANYGSYPGIFGSLTVNNLDSVEPNFGIQQVERTAAGSADRQFVCVGTADPSISMTSKDVSTILASCTTSAGLSCGAGEVQYQARSANGTFAGAGTNVTLNMSSGGFLMVNDFGAELGGDGATVSLTFHPVSSDGLTNPVTVNTSQSLSGSPTINAMHFVGPASVEGTALNNVQSIRFQTGMQVAKNIPSGGVWPDAVFITRRLPTLEIVARDLQALAIIGSGQYAISTGCVAYLRRATSNGTRVANNQSSHILISISAGMYKAESVSVSGQEDASTRITVYPTAYSISLASTIS